jgi:hypothetical protein
MVRVKIKALTITFGPPPPKSASFVFLKKYFHDAYVKEVHGI